MQNISKYVQINDFLLLEYEFSRDGTSIDISKMGATVALTDLGTKQYFNNVKGPGTDLALGITNNILQLNSVPTNTERSTWFNNYDGTDISSRYDLYFTSKDENIGINTDTYSHDTIKVHIISGYNFDDIVGFLLQIRAEDTSANLVDLSNFSYFKNQYTLASADVVNFATSPLYLGNRFYDKYVELKIPSVYALGNDTDTSLGKALSITPLSDVYFTYSTVPTLQSDSLTDDNTYTLSESIDVQLPVTSSADNFNAFIAESTNGDFIEYYATWNNQIIGQYMTDIESGRIPLYTSNNPNDNYQEFSEIYGTNAVKWVITHELYIYENLPGGSGGSSLLTQKFSFIQDDNWNNSNYFRPVLRTADIDATYTIQYICRLNNRMDGTQIIRRASFASSDPKKYGLYFTRLNVNNIIPYKVFNKIEGEKANIIEGSLKPSTKYIKVFYDTTGILFNEDGVLFPQGTGPLLLKTGDSVYKFKFEKYNETLGQKENVDLSGAYNYGLMFVLDDETKIESVPTYSTNMNTTIGELEFKLSGNQISKLLKQNNTSYSIVVKNPNGTYYSFYEGIYDSYIAYNEILEQEINYQEQISNLTGQKSALSTKVSGLISQKSALSTKVSGLTTKITGLTSKTTDITSKLSAANRIAGGFRTQIANLNKKIVILEAELKKLYDENAGLIDQNKTLSTATPEVITTLASPDPPQTLTTDTTLVKTQADKIKILEDENKILVIENNNKTNEIISRDDIIKVRDGTIRDMDKRK